MASLKAIGATSVCDGIFVLYIPPFHYGESANFFLKQKTHIPSISIIKSVSNNNENVVVVSQGFITYIKTAIYVKCATTAVSPRRVDVGQICHSMPNYGVRSIFITVR